MKFTSALLVMLALASCGTLKGLLDGAGYTLGYNPQNTGFMLDV
jgi:hypothetical protein